MAKVMIIEDDEPFLYVVDRELKAAGHETLPFHSWAGVLEALESGVDVDVMVTDLRLPAGTPNGLSLARMALARRPGLKMVYMTAFGDLAEDLKPTLPEVVLKDASTGAILAAVQAALEG